MTLNTHSALQRYAASDIPALMEKITKNSIGLDNYFDDFVSIFIDVCNEFSITKA